MSTLRELTIAKVVRACGEIQGRVKLQKIVYLLTAMGYGLPYRDFRIQHYGPFSPKLAAALDFLARAGVVRQKQIDVRSESPRYDYEVDGRWTKVLDDFVAIAAPESLASLEDVAGRLSKQDRAALEIAATMCYLQHEEGLAREELKNELRNLKGHLKPFDQKFEEAVSILKELDLNVEC